MVCGVGFRVSYDSVCESRPRICQRATDPVPARMVHASQRSDPRLRMEFQRCESSRSCMGRVGRIYQMTGEPGQRDRLFLSRVFQKLLLNFTWWVNRKDVRGKHVFSGGFLGLDNIGIFDRSKPLPTGGHLEQADGTAWMAYYCSSMLSIAFELADKNPAYADMASKFFEHYVNIAEAMNSLDGTGLWDEEDGFYYDHLHINGESIPLKIRSLVGIIPLFTVDVIHDRVLKQLPRLSAKNGMVSQKPFRTHRAHDIHGACG